MNFFSSETVRNLVYPDFCVRFMFACILFFVSDYFKDHITCSCKNLKLGSVSCLCWDFLFIMNTKPQNARELRNDVSGTTCLSSGDNTGFVIASPFRDGKKLYFYLMEITHNNAQYIIWFGGWPESGVWYFYLGISTVGKRRELETSPKTLLNRCSSILSRLYESKQ